MADLKRPSADQAKKESVLKELRREIEDKLEEQLPRLREVRPEPQEQEVGEVREMDEATCKRVMEALLFASSRPMTVQEMKRVIKGYKPVHLESMIRQLAAEYEQENRSFRINEIAGGFEIATRPEYAAWIMKLELDKKSRRASLSALETLAILAYKQPVTRVEIEELRGVDVSGVLATLLERDLIKIVGRKEVPGRPFLYGTTDKFLQHFGLKSLEDLPKIGEIRDLLESTISKEDLFRTEKIVEAPDEVAPSNEPAAPATGPAPADNT